jgi:hypothetical protein
MMLMMMTMRLMLMMMSMMIMMVLMRMMVEEVHTYVTDWKMHRAVVLQA